MFILYNPSDKSSPNSLNPDLVWASSMAQTVKNPPAMWETWAPSLGWEHPLEKGKGYPRQYSGLETSAV